MKDNTEYITDTKLLADVAQGSEDAFARLVHSLYKKFYPFTVSLIKSETEADDILQEVFLKIWLRRSMLPGIESPFGWICTVIANTASNHLRSRIRRELNIQKFSSLLPASDEIESSIDAKFTQSLINEAVSMLPEKRKIVFLLSKREGLSRREIAERLNISENTVRNQLTEALHFVQEHLSRPSDKMLFLLLITQCFPEIF